MKVLAAGRVGGSFCRQPPARDAPKGEGGDALDGPGAERRAQIGGGEEEKLRKEEVLFLLMLKIERPTI